MAIWSTQQDAALVAVRNWLRDPNRPQVFRLFGYAGTGKTTLAKHLVEDVDGDVLFAAYTGKATHVLRQKGCPNTSTIHKLIYNPKEKGRARLKELEEAMADLMAKGRGDGQEAVEVRRAMLREKDNLSQPAFSLNTDSRLTHAELLVIDECSMVDGRIGEDLLWFQKPILVLGDPAQLPPVAGTGFFIDHEPDIMLTDIHRQAQDNPIIHMATRVRRGEGLELGSYGESKVVARVEPEDAMAADQMLVGRNKTRHASNSRARRLLGIDDPLPTPGEKIVCLRNNHDLGLLNGSLWDLNSVGYASDDYMVIDVRSDDEGFNVYDVEAHTHYFLGNEDKLAWWERREREEFDYGYALTVHKSQGSQWDNVMLFDEAWCFREDARRWLYTGITRAAEKLTVVRI